MNQEFTHKAVNLNELMKSNWGLNNTKNKAKLIKSR